MSLPLSSTSLSTFFSSSSSKSSFFGWFLAYFIYLRCLTALSLSFLHSTRADSTYSRVNSLLNCLTKSRTFYSYFNSIERKTRENMRLSITLICLSMNQLCVFKASHLLFCFSASNFLLSCKAFLSCSYSSSSPYSPP